MALNKFKQCLSLFLLLLLVERGIPTNVTTSTPGVITTDDATSVTGGSPTAATTQGETTVDATPPTPDGSTTASGPTSSSGSPTAATTQGETTVDAIPPTPDGSTTASGPTSSSGSPTAATTQGETTVDATPPTPDGSTTASGPTSSSESTVTATPATPAGTTNAATTSAPGPCASNPCGLHSICQELASTYTCVCRPGLFYNDTRKSCDLAKTFPSDLKLIEITYDDGMADITSVIFETTAEKIVNALKNAFQNDTAYLGSTVLSLRKGSVIANIENFFSPLSKVTSEIVNERLKKAALVPGILSGSENTALDICTRGFCDMSSTSCTSTDGLATCACRHGYIMIAATLQACSSCPSGEKAVDLENCETCSFGYSGFNCEESYLLILVVVGCILGTLLLGTLTGALVLYSRSKKMAKSSENQPTKGSLEPAGIPRIPRANANAGWQPTNLEMTDSGSRHALVTRVNPETTETWDYDYPEDTRTNKSQTPSRTGYGAAGAMDSSRATRNPYYDAYDDKMRRY